MQPKLITLLVVVLLITACNPNTKKRQDLPSQTRSTEQVNEEEEPGAATQTRDDEEPAYYDDGNYCATVRYTNPHTGTKSIYMLNVEVADGKLVKIYWPNGGWLDESHFDAPHINDGGFTTFTSDADYEYEVLIKAEGDCDYTDARTFNGFSQNRSVYIDNSNDDDPEDEEPNKEEQYGSVRAVVYKRVDGCDYMILEENGDYYVAEWMGGYDPDEGDRIQGDLRHFGSKTCYVRSRDRETRLYIEDYRISLSEAWEYIRSQCVLSDDY